MKDKQEIDYNPSDLAPQIGYWATRCCELSAYVIENAEDREDIIYYREEDEENIEVYKTLYDLCATYLKDNELKCNTVEELIDAVTKLQEEKK